MIKVNNNKVDLTEDNETISTEFICLCICLLDNFSRMSPGHEEGLLKTMLDVAIKYYRKGGYK